MLDTHRMWLLALDTISGRPRARTMATGVAATLLLDLIDHGLAVWDAETVTATDRQAPADDELLAFGHARLVAAARSSVLRPSDAIDALYPQLWTITGQDLQAARTVRRRHQRLPHRTPRWDLVDPRTRTDLLRDLRHAVRSPASMSTSSHHLAAVLWATDIEDHGLFKNSLFNTSATQALALIMATDPLADRLSHAVAHLISGTAQIGGNPNLY